MFEYDFTDEFKLALRKLAKKYNKRAQIIKKKVREIIANDSVTINRYYNCSYDLKRFKHCHIDKSFVILFEVFPEDNLIVFSRLGHHDDFFKK